MSEWAGKAAGLPPTPEEWSGILERHSACISGSGERANLRRANLQGANLQGANLQDANGSELAIAMTRILPEGELVVWKKCSAGVLVQLRVPHEAKRSHAFGRKCRAEFADVLDVIGAEVGVTDAHGPRTEYREGERVTADSWDEDWRNECSHGVHFYITRAEAEAHE